MDFLDIAGKTFLIFGVANKKSVAYAVAQVIAEAGAKVVHVVQSPETRANVSKILPGRTSMCVMWNGNMISKTWPKKSL